MTQIGLHLSELKSALQELETAVQQPRDERSSIEQMLDKFPQVFMTLNEVIQNVLASQGIWVENSRAAFTQAYNRGWLKGELSLWLRLLSDYQQIKEEDTHGARARAVAQDVRACSSVLWETYELLTSKFRWQTQVQPVTKVSIPHSAAGIGAQQI